MDEIDFGVAGKSAVVLGVSPGMGLECARCLAKAGANVACVDIRPEIADGAAATIAALGRESLAIDADVLNRVSVKSAFDKVMEDWGSLDILVNVVGITQPASFAEMDDVRWAAQIDINLRHHFIAAQEAVHRMRGRGGAIVMFGSVAGLRSPARISAYGAAKAAVSSLAQTIAVEHGADGIRCNVIAPGATMTPRMKVAFEATDRLADLQSYIPLGRPADPAEIAKAVLFLASDLSSYVTGQTLYCDGGSVAKGSLPAP